MAKAIPNWIPNTLSIVGFGFVLLVLGYMIHMHMTAPKWVCTHNLTYTLTFHSDKSTKYNDTETKTVCTHYSEK